MDDTERLRMMMELEQAGQPAFGFFPQMRARRTRQDPEAAKTFPVDVARGVVSGALGAPGDIESLIRLIPGLDKKTILPTSEEIEQRLPLRSDTPAGRAGAGLGILAGGAYSGPGSGVRAVTSVAGALPKAARDFVQAAGQPAVNVIKPKGGNWLTGTVENALEPLKSSNDAVMVEMLRQADPRFVDQALVDNMISTDKILNNWVDTKLNKYIKNEMATAEDPVRLQADAFIKEKADMLAAKDKQLDKARADLQRAQQERGVAPEVLTRSQARIRELQKERDFINEMQGLHFTPRTISERDRAHLATHRPEQGFPAGGLGESDLARAWENVADVATNLDTAGANQASAAAKLTSPWLEKLPPETPVYGITRADSRDLGLDHLTDELRNALNPNSGLPEKLLLTPEKLSKMNVPQAVKHVDEINAWRALQKREADAARAANEATHTIKEYPEANKRWVELKMPDAATSLPKGWQIKRDKLPNAGEIYYAVNEHGGTISGGNAVGRTYEEALQNTLKDLYKKPLEDALKYEGEMLQHCVGGYCDRVLQGNSRIISLRDDAGRPQVTIEMQPEITPDKLRDILPLKKAKELELTAKRALGFNERSGPHTYNMGNLQRFYSQLGKELQKSYPDLAENANAIKQIKTAKNAFVSGENVQYVKDFLNSRPFGHVMDLPRGLVDSRLLGKVGFEDAKQMFGKRFLSLEEAQQLPTYIPPRPPDGFADGGEVTIPDMTDGGRVIDGGPFKRGGTVRMSKNPDTMRLELMLSKMN